MLNSSHWANNKALIYSADLVGVNKIANYHSIDNILVEEQPKIQFGGKWMPAHQVWDTLEVVTTMVEMIDRYNQNHPELATAITTEVVPLVRQRLRDMEVIMPARSNGSQELQEAAQSYFELHSPEDVLDLLQKEHNWSGTLNELIQIVGDGYYLNALKREARDYENNMVSPEQTAALWGDLQRPVPGGGIWSPMEISRLLTS